jgi:hypothetical protein
MMSRSKALGYLHSGRDLVCFRGSFVHQSDLLKGLTQSFAIFKEIFDFVLLFFSTCNARLCFLLSLYVLAMPAQWLREHHIPTIAHQWYEIMLSVACYSWLHSRYPWPRV